MLYGFLLVLTKEKVYLICWFNAASLQNTALGKVSPNISSLGFVEFEISWVIHECMFKKPQIQTKSEKKTSNRVQFCQKFISVHIF